MDPEQLRLRLQRVRGELNRLRSVLKAVAAERHEPPAGAKDGDGATVTIGASGRTSRSPGRA